MTVHHMKLNPLPFAMIASGQKTVELRLNDEKRKRISVGDEIQFSRTDGEATIRCRVVALHAYPSFRELYQALPLTSIGYTEETAPAATPEDMDAYYTEEDQAKYGALGIEILRIEL